MRRAVWAFALCAFIARTAGAEPTRAELDEARAEFSRGLAAEDAKRFAEALEHYRTVMKTKATPQLRLHAAFCLRKTGHLVEAAAELDRAQADGVALGAQGEELAGRAVRERDELYASTPRLSVKLSSGGRPRSVTLDGAATTLGDEPLALDPGEHHLVVETSNGPYTRDFVVQERRPAMVEEVLVPDGMGPRRYIPAFIGVGLTVATFGAMIVTGVMQTSVASTLDAQCGAPDYKSCPTSEAPDIDKVHALTTATNVLLVSGLVLAAATTVLFIVPSLRARRHPTAFITPFGVTARF